MKSFLPLLLSTLLAVSAALAQTKPLTNDDIVQMTKAGFDEQTIVKAIQANEPAFTTSIEALLSLKNAGITKPVIDAMLDREANKAAPDQTTDASAIGEHILPPAHISGRAAKREQKLVDAAIYVEEVSSSGGVVASSDTALEAMKTLQEKHVRVVTIKDRADFILQVTRQLGKKSWKKDTKVVLSNRNGDVVLAKSTRSVGGAMGDVVDYVRKHSE